MQLSKEAIRDIYNLAEHYLNETDSQTLQDEYQQIMNIVSTLRENQRIFLEARDLFPADTGDLVLDLLFKELSRALDKLASPDSQSEDATKLAETLDQYLEEKYDITFSTEIFYNHCYGDIWSYYTFLINRGLS